MKTYKEFFEEYSKNDLHEGVYDQGILKAVFTAGGPGCFHPDTLVQTTNGYKKISEIKTGEFVKTLNEETNEVTDNEVTHVLKNKIRGIAIVELEDGTLMECTHDHMIRLSDGSWKEAGQLQENEELWCNMKVQSVTIKYEDRDFYDLRVENNHNYFVTENNVNVHNSGKSFMAKKAGLGKLNRHGIKIINSDEHFERLLKDAGMEMNPENIFSPKGQEIRGVASQLTKKFQSTYMSGRLGLLIDGTGKNYDKIKKTSDALKNIGYDTYMLFINTSLEVAQQRNQERARSLDPEEVEKMWRQVQSNIGKFQNYFDPQNFILVDNDNAGEDVFAKMWKTVNKLVSEPVKNPIGKKWIQAELEMKKRS